jgi:BlaI family transcriptional regulator, penicillinase repressor
VGTEGLTDLQLALMKVLWRIGEGTLSDIVPAMNREGRQLAPTTIATLLQRLTKQGWVKHRPDGRQFVYRAAVDRKEAADSMLKRVLSAFFGGKVSALTAQLLESQQLEPEDLEEMRKLLRNNKKRTE